MDPRKSTALAQSALARGDDAQAFELLDALTQTDELYLPGLMLALMSAHQAPGADAARRRRYLERAAALAGEHPEIWHRGACLLMDLDERDRCLAWIDQGIKSGYDVYALRAEPAFKALHDLAAFQQLFEGDAARSLLGTAEGAQMLALATDLAHPGDGLREAVELALRHPPTTVQTIGFYPHRHNTTQENCFRFLVSQLGQRGRIMAAEDKYCTEVLDAFARVVELPDSLVRLFEPDPESEELPVDRVSAGYAAALRALEQAFEAAGSVLCTLWTGGGDTIHFIATSATVAERWAGVPIVHTHEGQPLGLLAPTWDAFFWHLVYATGWDPDVELPPGCTPSVWREGDRHLAL